MSFYQFILALNAWQWIGMIVIIGIIFNALAEFGGRK